MPTEIHEFSVVVPTGTPASAPLTFDLNFPPRIVDEIEVQVPPGPRGEVGFAIGQAGTPIFPYEAGSFVVTDDRTLVWQLEGANTSGAWQISAYNTGQFNHSLYIRFRTRLPEAPADSAAPVFAESTSLSSDPVG